MVWVHGGGFSSGSSAENYIFDGKNLSKKGDVVVVSVNHRLNSLGFLDLSAYGEKYKNSANAGIMDLVASLEWIRDNIEEFGGDPNNVTIFGESGGGAKVLTLMATPAAKGLFHKAISESGAVEKMGMTLLPEKTTRRVAELTLENLGLNAKNVDEIQKIPYEKVMEATNKALTKTAEEQGYKNVLTGQPGLDWAPKLDSYIPVEPVGEKYSEQSRLYRYEKSGALSGLERVRSMDLTEGHVFVRPDQIKNEFKHLYKMITTALKDFNIEIDHISLSLRDPQDTEKFFEMKYVDDNEQQQTPVLIHRGLIGTYERFIATLLEQTKGVLPY